MPSGQALVADHGADKEEEAAAEATSTPALRKQTSSSSVSKTSASETQAPSSHSHSHLSLASAFSRVTLGTSERTGVEKGKGSAGDKGGWSGIKKEVALKVIPKKKVKGNEEAVWGEMEVLRGLDHPNIVSSLLYINFGPLYSCRDCRSSSTSGSNRGRSTICPSNLLLAENCLNASRKLESSQRKTQSPLFGMDTCFTCFALSYTQLYTSRSILSGVKYLHDHDIVHRDLK